MKARLLPIARCADCRHLKALNICNHPAAMVMAIKDNTHLHEDCPLEETDVETDAELLTKVIKEMDEEV